jgi:hypothetical protein
MGYGVPDRTLMKRKGVGGRVKLKNHAAEADGVGRSARNPIRVKLKNHAAEADGVGRSARTL